jgi:hypothetical protein
MKNFYLTRRRFLLSLAAAGAALGGIYFSRKNTRGDVARIVPRIVLLQNVLQWELPYAVIEQQTLESFYHDLRQDDSLFRSLLEVEKRLRKNPRLLQAGNPPPAVKFYSANLATAFLLSTSFFYDREMRYLGLYSPYKRPCQNPFANLG